MLSGNTFSQLSANPIPFEYRKKFNELFEFKVAQAPFGEDLERTIRTAEQTTCRLSHFEGYLKHALARVNLAFLLFDRKTGEILSFAIAKQRQDIPVFMLSLICGKRGNSSTYYGSIVHSLVAAYCIAIDVESIVLSASNKKNANYYEYLGYKYASYDEEDRIIALSRDGLPMILSNIADSALMKLFSSRLEKTLYALTETNLKGHLKMDTSWRSLSRFFAHHLQPMSDISYYSLRANLKIDFVKELLLTASWMSWFAYNTEDASTYYGIAIAKEHIGGLAELCVIHAEYNPSLKTSEADIIMPLKDIAALLLLRFLKRRGFTKAFTLETDNEDELLKMGFVPREPGEQIIVPTSRDFYVIELDDRLKQKTNEFVQSANEILEANITSTTTMDDFYEQ